MWCAKLGESFVIIVKKGQFARMCKEGEIRMISQEENVELPHKKCIFKANDSNDSSNVYQCAKFKLMVINAACLSTLVHLSP